MMKPRDLVTSYIVIIVVITIMATSVTSLFSQATVIEYCQFEVFNATCGEGTLVMMVSARYGRMKLGRCLESDSHLGCSTDVLIFMDSQCSGKPSCSFQLPVSALYRQQNCPKDVYAYLEASYTCVTVSSLTSMSCTNSDSIRIQNVDEGHLSSFSSQTFMQGTQSCPWKISVRPGQTIRLILYDFSVANRYKSEAEQSQRAYSTLESRHLSNDYCHLYATVNEPEVGPNKKSNICARNSREHEVYLSLTNQIVVEVSELVVVDTTISFMIKFKALGCAHYQPPRHAWAERSGDKLIVRCNTTQQSWHMICRGITWVGQASECDQDFPVGEKVVDDGVFPTYGLVIAVIVGIFVGSLCGFVLLAIVLWCRRQTSNRNLNSTPCAFDREVELSSALADTMVDENNICKIHRLPTGEYGYTHVWKVRNTQLPFAPPHHQHHQHHQQQQQQHYAANKKQLPGNCCSKVYAPSRHTYLSSHVQDSSMVIGSETPTLHGIPNNNNNIADEAIEHGMPALVVQDLHSSHPKYSNKNQRCHHACTKQQLDVIDNTNNYIRDCPPLFDERFLSKDGVKNCEMISFKPVMMSSAGYMTPISATAPFHPCDVAMTSLNPVKVDEH